MKNKDFFYQQYNKIDWKKQDSTKINFLINNYISDQIILKSNKSFRLFDIGFGIGFFFEMINDKLTKQGLSAELVGCEPSIVNFNYFEKKRDVISWGKGVSVKAYNSTFLNINIDSKFDFVTAIYVFPNFVFSELDEVVKKIYSLLNVKGKFILVVAEENYLKNKLEQETDLCIEKTSVEYEGKTYEEVLHYTDIPEIGKVIDYNRSETLYNDLFLKNEFKFVTKEKINDSGFMSSLFVFEKN